MLNVKPHTVLESETNTSHELNEWIDHDPPNLFYIYLSIKQNVSSINNQHFYYSCFVY